MKVQDDSSGHAILQDTQKARRPSKWNRSLTLSVGQCARLMVSWARLAQWAVNFSKGIQCAINQMDANENGGMLFHAIRSSRLISPISLRQRLNTTRVLNSFHFLLSHARHVSCLSYSGKTALSKHPALVTTAARQLDWSPELSETVPSKFTFLPRLFG